MFTKFGGVITSVIPVCNCFFRELHVIKLPDKFIKFVIIDVDGNDGGVLDVNQGFRVICYSSWCGNKLRETKELQYCFKFVDAEISQENKLFEITDYEIPR